jgi:hypothetical protein
MKKPRRALIGSSGKRAGSDNTMSLGDAIVSLKVVAL